RKSTPSPEIWSETISGREEVLARKWGGLFLGYLLGKKDFRRRDRDHLVPPRRTDAAVCRAEVCYAFGRKHRRHRAVKRREVIPLLGGVAASPVAARAQQPIPVVGFLNSAGDKWTAAFRKGLSEEGQIEGRNVAIELRSTEQYGEVPSLAAELVQRRVT